METGEKFELSHDISQSLFVQQCVFFLIYSYIALFSVLLKWKKKYKK